MKRILTIGTIVGMYLVLGCTKQNATVGTSTTPSTSNAGLNGRSVARTAGEQGYSESISLDEANRMIQSYLTSVNYPSVDNSLRALTFNADTLRKYLSNPSIKNIKFVVAHQPSYLIGNFGKNAGMNPQAMTMIVVGLNENNGYVLNQDNGVYEHMNPCPTYCGNEDAYIH